MSKGQERTDDIRHQVAEAQRFAREQEAAEKKQQALITPHAKTITAEQQHTKSNNTPKSPIQTQGWYRRLFATKAPNFLLASAVLATGVGAIVLGGAPVAMGCVSIAIEMYKVTPAYDGFVKTKWGKRLHQGTKMLFSRLNRRIFKMTMAGIGLAAAAAVSGGVLPAIFIGVNLAGVAYNMTQEVRELRQARRLSRQATKAKQYTRSSDAITQLIGHKPELMRELGIKIAKPKTPPKEKPLNMKATFAKNLGANIWEGVAGVGGAIVGNSGDLVKAMNAISMTGEVSRDTRNDLNGAAEKANFKNVIAQAGFTPKEIEEKAVEQEATALALASTMQTMSIDDGDFKKTFEKNKSQEIKKLQSKEPTSPKQWYKKVMQAIKNLGKDVFSLHTSPLNDPTDRAYKQHHTNAKRIAANPIVDLNGIRKAQRLLQTRKHDIGQQQDHIKLTNEVTLKANKKRQAFGMTQNSPTRKTQVEKLKKQKISKKSTRTR